MADRQRLTVRTCTLCVFLAKPGRSPVPDVVLVLQLQLVKWDTTWETCAVLKRAPGPCRGRRPREVEPLQAWIHSQR